MKKFWQQYCQHNIPFHILTGIAIAMILTAFFIPPQAEIHPSVLIATGEIFAFASLYSVVKAIDQGRTAKIRHKDTELEISNEEKEIE